MPNINRERSPLVVLGDPKTEIISGEHDIRLDDYLNDKIQTNSDFKNIASLIASVELQKTQLEKQLQDARTALQDAKNASTNHTSQMLEQTQEYERQYNKVQANLMNVAEAPTPELAAHRLKGPMEKLRRVELAKSYVELLTKVDSLSEEARSHLPGDPKESLKPYTKLKEMSISLGQRQVQAEGAAVHLVTYVQTTTENLWLQMKKIMSDEFEAVLKRSSWPSTALEPSREWVDCFERLLVLQNPEIVASRDPVILLPMDVLAKQFVLSFRYHFFTVDKTSRPSLLGKFFTIWFLDTVKEYQEFLRQNITPILVDHFRGSPLTHQSIYIDPVAGFISALLPVVKEKVQSVLDQVSHVPESLSEFIIELLTFDDTVRNVLKYDGGNVDSGWKGLSWDVLDVWFDRWSAVEKDFGLKRYQEIIRSSEAGKLDYEGTLPGKTKPTFGAIQVVDLLATVTTKYSKLRRLKQKMRFLINIQAEIFDQYLGRLSDSLEIYNATISAVGRTLHGVTREQQAALEGLGGLESLCKVYGSADYFISVLKEWKNEEFFVQFWEQLQNRAKKTGVRDNLAGPMTYTEVQDVISTAVGSDSDGSMFDVTIDNYEGIRQKAEDAIVLAIKSSYYVIFKQYRTKAHWTTIGEVPSPITDLAISSELDSPLRTLREYLEFTFKALSTIAHRKIWRQCHAPLQDFIFNEVILKQDFTTLGAARLSQDFIAIQNTLAVHSPQRTIHGLTKLAEAVVLLNLPLEPEEGQVGLKDASRDVFGTNAGAEQLIKRLGFVQLSMFDARSVLGRRVESNNLDS